MNYPVRKTVVIGLGGTGRDAVLHLKRKYMEVFGTDTPPTTRFLVFDTTAAKPMELPSGEKIELGPGEFVQLVTSNPAGFVQNHPDIRSWFPKDGVPLSAIVNGAGQVRATGRLALFANAKLVYERIKLAVDSINSIQPFADLGPFDLYINPNGQSPVLINIVGSLSGGTGSGTFIDVAFICRSFMGALDTLAGYLLLPDVFVGKPAAHNVQPNAYGALKELDMLMNRGLQDNGVSYRFNGIDIPMDRSLFDLVFLVNNRNKLGTVFQDVEDLTEQIGMGIFVSSGAVGKGATDVWDNLKNMVSGLSYDGKRAFYASFGVSELVLNARDEAMRMTLLKAVRLIDSTFLSADLGTVAKDAETFIDRNELREHGADHVIDALHSPGQFNRLNIPKSVGKKDIGDVLKKRSSHLSAVEQNVRGQISEQLERLTDKHMANLREHVQEVLSKPNGLLYAVELLGVLISSFDAFRKEMEGERDAFKEQRNLFDGRIESIEKAVEQAKGKFFGADSELTKQAENFKRAVNEEASVMVETLRRNSAITLYSTLVGEARRMRDDLDGLADRIRGIKRSLNESAEQLRMQRRAMRPFTVELEPTDQTNALDGAGAGQDWLVKLQREGRSVSNLAAISADELKVELLQFVSQRPLIQQMYNLRLEDVLGAMSSEDFEHKMKVLDSRAAPLWEYDGAALGAGAPPTQVHIIGVQNEQNTIAKPDNMSRALQGRHQLVSTSDPHRFYVYKFEAAVPAFAISGMSTYRSFYEANRQNTSYHVHKDWMGAPDLFPNASEGVLRVWSLANASPFNFIVKKGAHYYARSRKHGHATDDYLVPLGQGRERALRGLEDNPRIVAELEGEIQAVEKKLGSSQVAGELEQHIDRLLKERPQSDSIKHLIEDEVQTIRQYLDNVQSFA